MADIDQQARELSECMLSPVEAGDCATCAEYRSHRIAAALRAAEARGRKAGLLAAENRAISKMLGDESNDYAEGHDDALGELADELRRMADEGEPK